MEVFSATNIVLFLVLAFIAAIIYIRYQFYVIRKQILLALGVRDDLRRARGPKLLTKDPVKRKPRIAKDNPPKKEGE